MADCVNIEIFYFNSTYALNRRKKDIVMKMIKNQRQAESLRAEILAKDASSFYTTKLVFSKDGSVSRRLLMDTANQETAHLGILSNVYAVTQRL